ncbi:hypothetical protein AVEN_115867-1 [Araneus ventricosus]|uniref:Uncharacterized protein n=1 Tax=Araneus ventricosus TaxID=182803 RepID=A0A4Y2K4R8_ARAVE|nr:hypothetical protein AVEN_115867-1 [Araneus ventricosus]
MDLPVMSAMIFAEDLLRFTKNQARIPMDIFDFAIHSMSQHRGRLYTRFNGAIAKAVHHKYMKITSNTIAYTNGFRYEKYYLVSVEEASTLLLNAFSMLIIRPNGFLKVCAFVMDVFICCMKREKYVRAYDTYLTFICFLIKQDVCSGPNRNEGWREINAMALNFIMIYIGQ